MRVWIAAVGAKPRAGFEELARMYLERMAPYLSGGGKGGVEAPVFRTEEGLWAAVERERARTTPRVVLLDEGGRQMGSEEFAQWLGGERDAGRQLVIFAVGPADGWKQSSEQRAQFPGKHWGSAGGPVVVDKKANRQPVRRHTAGEAMVLSLGPMTMAHELARVVICEQVYRALTILAGHPYHRV